MEECTCEHNPCYDLTGSKKKVRTNRVSSQLTEDCTCERNPCYDLTGYKKKPRRNRVNSQTSYVSIQQRRAKSGNKKWIGVLITIFIVQALLLIAAVAIAAGFVSKMYGRIEQINEQITEKPSLVNNTNYWLQLKNLQSSLDTLTNQVDNLWSSVNTLNTTTMDQLNDLQSSVNTLNTTTMDQLKNLQSSVNASTTAQDTTDTQVSSLQSSLNTLTAQQTSTTFQVTSLQSLMNNLTSQINSSIDPFQNCVEETKSCTIRLSSDSRSYWAVCNTPFLINYSIIVSFVFTNDNAH